MTIVAKDQVCTSQSESGQTAHGAMLSQTLAC